VVTERANQFRVLPPEDWGQLDPLLPHVDHVGDVLAVQWNATDTPDDDLLRRAADFVYSTRLYVEKRPQMIETEAGRVLRGLNWLEMGLDASQQSENEERAALFAANLGFAWNNLGEKRKALDYYEQGLAIRRELGDQKNEATMLNNIGSVWDDLGKKRKALQYYEQALSLYRAVGDRGSEATTLVNIGSAWDDLGKKRKALQYYEQALPLYRAVGDRGSEATTLNNIGAAWFALGEKRKALQYYEQALTLFRAVGDRNGEAVTLFNMSFIIDDIDQAIEWVKIAYDLLLAIESPYAESHVAPRLAQLKREALPQPSQKEIMQMLPQVYRERGEDGVREMLAGQVDEEIIVRLIYMLRGGSAE